MVFVTDSEALDAACEAACEVIDGCYELGRDACLAGCRGASAGCASAFVEVLDCIAAQTDPATCDLPAACEEPLRRWADCEAWCLEKMKCQDLDDGCSCSLDACGPTKRYEVECVEQNTGLALCDCIVDGVRLGSCTDVVSRCESPKLIPCCATVVFPSGN